MTKDNLPFRDRRVTGAPVYDPAIPAPVLRLPAISHEEALTILDQVITFLRGGLEALQHD